MKMRALHIIVLVFGSLGLYGQDDYVLDKDSLKVKDKIHYNFTVGAGFGYSSNVGEYFSTYYSPSISYDVSPRFRLTGGFTYVNSSVDGIPLISDNNYSFFSGNISQYYSFIEGTYQLSDRLTVGGSLFYDFSKYQDVAGNTMQQQNDLSNLGGSAFVRYKVGKSMFIEAEVRVNDRSPFRNSFFGAAEHSFLGR
jgi:hypothetical protein